MPDTFALGSDVWGNDGLTGFMYSLYVLVGTHEELWSMIDQKGPLVNCGSYEASFGDPNAPCFPCDSECWTIGCVTFAPCPDCQPHTMSCMHGMCHCRARPAMTGGCECEPGRVGERCTLPCPCEKCDTEGNCVDGGIPYNLQVCTCPVGQSEIDGICQFCYFNCESCENGVTDLCASCKPGHALSPHSTTCVSDCPTGFRKID
jgi:hypothetical protein